MLFAAKERVWPSNSGRMLWLNCITNGMSEKWPYSERSTPPNSDVTVLTDLCHVLIVGLLEILVCFLAGCCKKKRLDQCFVDLCSFSVLGIFFSFCACFRLLLSFGCQMYCIRLESYLQWPVSVSTLRQTCHIVISWPYRTDVLLFRISLWSRVINVLDFLAVNIARSLLHSCCVVLTSPMWAC